MNKQLARRDAILLNSGVYDTESWGGLRKRWKGFGIAKVDGRYQEDGILCKRYKEIPEGIENIGIRIPTICSVTSKDARRIRFRKLLARQ